MSSEEEDDTLPEEDSEIDSDLAGSDEEDAGVRHFSSVPKSDSQTGEAVRAQLALWDGLLETRIKLQKPLTNCNTLPYSESFRSFSKSSGDASGHKLKSVHTDLRQLLRELVELQDGLMDQDPSLSDTFDHDGGESGQRDLLSDELSDSSFPLEAIEEELAQRHAKFDIFRNNTLESWNSKTQQYAIGGAKGFSAFDQSPVKQIEQVLGDRNRLIQRTRTRRSGYHILGTATNSTISGDNVTSRLDEPSNPSASKPSVDSQIFDDDDFYHQLLRELIERKTGETSDPLELTRQQVHLAQLRKRTKKMVDSKATRDRKMKFDPHPKLLNFMAPRPACSITEQARNDLYKSLFGKLQRSKPTEEEDVAAAVEGIRILR